jgi:hypothetical protein
MSFSKFIIVREFSLEHESVWAIDSTSEQPLCNTMFASSVLGILKRFEQTCYSHREFRRYEACVSVGKQAFTILYRRNS